MNLDESAANPSLSSHEPLSFDQAYGEPLSPSQQLRLAEILDEYLMEAELGIPPDQEQLISRHPELADRLRAHLKSLDLLHFAARGFGSPAISPPTAPPLIAERRLGEYEIVREIGRGGMGIVYEARQASLQRKVALKVLPFAAVLDQKQIARFNNEARSAAQLHHPHIVPIYAVGCERGVHFYAMQYIEGQPLDRVIRELRESNGIESPIVTTGNSTQDGDKPLRDPTARSTVRGLSTAGSIRSRNYFHAIAELGIQVATALQHAHEYGVVHRDIKPSNLLLDEAGLAWVTDFGLARCQADTSLTAAGDVLGTVRYMSPEQAAGKPVDERTDIYSLGVTLYELLTLRTAFDAPNRAQFAKLIENDEPRAPRRWNPSIPVDLETIVLKAMAKAKEQRYASAAALADDLQAYLASKTIRARRPSMADHASKWVSRHRTIVSLAAGMMLVLLVGSLASLMLIWRAKSETNAALLKAEHNLQREETQRQLAAQNYQQAREAVDRLGGDFAAKLQSVPGAEPIRNDLLRQTLQYYQRFLELALSEEGARDPGLLLDIAVTQFKAATLLEQLGEHPKALAGYRTAKQQFESLEKMGLADDADAPAASNGPDGSEKNLRLQRNIALCHNNEGLLLERMGQIRLAEENLRKSLAIQQKLLATANSSEACEHAAAQTFNNLGLLLGRTERRPEAEECFAKGAALLEKIGSQMPGVAKYQADLATTYNNLATFYSETDLKAAEQFGRKAIVLQKQVVAKTPLSPEAGAELATSYSNLGAILRRSGRNEDASAAYEEAIHIERSLVKNSPAVVRYRSDLAAMLNNLGSLQIDAEAKEFAGENLEQARAVLVELLSHFPKDAIFQSHLAGVMGNIGLLCEQRHELEKAVAAYQGAVSCQQAAIEASPQIAKSREYLEHYTRNLERVQRAAAKLAKSPP